MQHIDNDMDDLFRKSADNYPLKATPDWNKLSEKLHAVTPATTLPEKKNNKRRLLWLLLLLPFSFICTTLIYNPFAVNQKPVTAQKKQVIEKNDKANDKNTSIQHITPLVKETEIEKNNKQGIDKTNDLVFAMKKTEEKFKLQSLSSNVFDLQNNEAYKRSSGIESQRNLQLKEQTNEATLKNRLNENNFNEKQNDVELNKENVITEPNADTSTITKNPSDSSRVVSLNRRSKDTVAKQKKRGLYIGFVTGPDISTVKFQQVKKAGYTLGLIAGYHINQHFSLETGFFWDKKNYYSTGEYFDKARTGIPDHVNIKSLAGNCSMFEIPLNVRYDFTSKRSGNFYVSTGVSSYLMKKENYDYQAEYYGNEYSEYKSYINSTDNIFSLWNISAGYQFKLGNSTGIRIEPYYKIPLKGVGIGKMPLSSAGIYFGITRSLK